MFNKQQYAADMHSCRIILLILQKSIGYTL